MVMKTVKLIFTFIDKNGRETFIEVKSVTLLEGQQGYFPDAVTQRGQKHLRELMTMTANGHRAVLLFAVLHSGINTLNLLNILIQNTLSFCEKLASKVLKLLLIKLYLKKIKTNLPLL